VIYKPQERGGHGGIGPWGGGGKGEENGVFGAGGISIAEL